MLKHSIAEDDEIQCNERKRLRVKLTSSHLVQSWLLLLSFVALISLILPTYGSATPNLVITQDGTKAFNHTLTVSCRANFSVSELWWSVLRLPNEEPVNVTEPKVKKQDEFHEVSLIHKHLALQDIGQYICNAVPDGDPSALLRSTYNLTFRVPPRLKGQKSVDVNETNDTSLTCKVYGYPVPNSIRWSFESASSIPLSNSSNVGITVEPQGETEFTSKLVLRNVSIEQHGKYYCNTDDGLSEETNLTVKGKPRLVLDVIMAVTPTEIFVNWTINNGNSNITSLKLMYFGNGSENVVNLEPTSTIHLLQKLTPLTIYSNFSLVAQNLIGTAEDIRVVDIKTLEETPVFIPKVILKGSTSGTVTLGWTIAQSLTNYYHYYNVSIQDRVGKITYRKSGENPEVMVENLRSGMDYSFRVAACSEYTHRCDEFSELVNGTTMDGMSSPPRNIIVKCHFDERSHEATVKATWDDPTDPQGMVAEYAVVLSGNATYHDEQGRLIEETVGPINKAVRATSTKTIEFTKQPPNTQLFVTVCAKTRVRLCGESAKGSCATPSTIPDTDALNKASWKAVQNKRLDIFFMITLPSISQRNGTICCIRIVVVKLNKDQSVSNLRPPSDWKIQDYEAVHNSSSAGAYVAEILDPKSQSIMIGDGSSLADDKKPCQKCWSHFDSPSDAADGSFRPSVGFPINNQINKVGKRHWKRHAASGGDSLYRTPFINPRDGPLDSESYYTVFLDAIVLNEKHEHMRAQSKYFHPLRPVRVAEQVTLPGTAIVVSLIAAVLVLLVSLMCVMRWRRKEPGDQEYGLSHSIQQWCRRLRGQQPIPSDEPPILPPIPKDQLVTAFLERHKDSDLGFQQEFEKLPDRFCDRTSEASDSRDNVGKNRYPDIKAYDQTRIRLSTSDGNADYINANLVVGYKERKKFICAQGPMDGTVNDWWRMIWEQHVHFILMLTNVEEYNKTKCAKYWPSEGSTNYADFVVTHSSELRYSDFLVRYLKLSKNRPSSSNDDSPKEEREVLQYHYLVWKDFMAPEYPVGILRFIKRFNEMYSPDKGPILVHCSAGVGRTGTLVALDSMLQELREEERVSIFNTICDLRHQRNYLVQSLKQYVFIYRALMELAQFGDTELTVSDLKSNIDKLKTVPDGKITSKMQEEFERLSQVIEDRKPFAIGSSDENKHRNRHENVIPYDRNRVILSPMPSLTKEICTYINASFIEGYDNSEQFIIAQDPLDNTVGDFWRMMVEQNIRSVVMLSETGDEQCPRYWPEKDQETSHDYIKVKYMQSQSFPFYLRREFTVTETKSDNVCLVTQFQYNGWPMGEGEVPQADRGIVELIDTVLKFKDSLGKEKSCGPTVVHCSNGADRSSIFVAIAILAQQMMNESRVDVYSVVRKLRSQRQGLFRNFAQYEFVYRALVTYAELHVANGSAGH
ncbi:Tyrosine-protein phosphatase 69D [Orchesella cincta]|uniref:protein-tyrosine-phosphatase n=1 Tax=Orchesella cincta TaxID=48709 RepID=A0A1D2N865_ORCCI|nr:Tyrosine-protein phosphatase 69D [Orchesella cincta]